MKNKISWHHKRCGAKSRDGDPCKNWAMPNGRCRMHGGKSTGPKRPENRGKSGFKHGASIKRILNDTELAYFKSIRRQLRKEYPNLPTAGKKTLDDLCLCIVRMNRIFLNGGNTSASTYASLESKIRKHFKALNTGKHPVRKPAKKQIHSTKLTEFTTRFKGGCSQ